MVKTASLRNTYQKGQARVFIYPEKSRFVAVCLDFNLVEEAETLGKAIEYIEDAVRAHVETVIKNKLSEDLLNRPASPKYWKKFKKYLEAQARLAEMQAFARRTRKEITLEDWVAASVLNTFQFPDSNFTTIH